jgi:hypothetical protein
VIDSRELVPPDSYEYCKSRELNPLILIDSRLVRIYGILKTKFSKIYCNNWHVGGDYKQSGYRNDGSGAIISQHRFGRALDLHGVEPHVLYKHILNSRKIFYKDIKAVESLEDTKGWVHIDVRYSLTEFTIVRG